MSENVLAHFEERMTYKMANIFIRSMSAGATQIAYQFLQDASDFEIGKIPAYEVSEETRAFIRSIATIINLPGPDDLTGENIMTVYVILPIIFRLKIKA